MLRTALIASRPMPVRDDLPKPHSQKSTGIPFCAICDELKLLKSSEDPEVRGVQSELVTRLSTRSIGTGRPPTSGIRSNLPQLS